MERFGEPIRGGDRFYEGTRYAAYEGRMYEILQLNPEVARFLNQRALYTAGSRLSQAVRVLPQNPQLLDQLRAVHAQHPERVALAVVPEFGIVISQNDDRLSILAPIMGCTLNAVDDLVRQAGLHIAQGEYGMVISHTPAVELEMSVWQIAEKNPREILTYDPNLISPEDYVALAATGMLSNETFRQPLPAALR